MDYKGESCGRPQTEKRVLMPCARKREREREGDRLEIVRRDTGPISPFNLNSAREMKERRRVGPCGIRIRRSRVRQPVTLYGSSLSILIRIGGRCGIFKPIVDFREKVMRRIKSCGRDENSVKF